jgi:hypothetical protein
MQLGPQIAYVRVARTRPSGVRRTKQRPHDCYAHTRSPGRW